jgi:dTDP-4-dehydrorhamnose reductase
MLATDLCPALEKAGHTVVACRRADLDIEDRAACHRSLRTHQPDAVINCAAWTNVDGAETNTLPAYRANCLGAAHLAHACAETGAWLVQLSTDFVFDGTKTTPYTEFDTTNPQSVYGASKEAGEQWVRQLLPMRHLICRVSYLFGAHGKNLISTIVHAGRTRPELAFVSDQTISPTYTVDAVAALVALLVAPFPGTYHLCNDGSCTPHALAETVLRHTGIATPVLPLTLAEYTARFHPPATRPQNSAMVSLMRQMRGDNPLPVWQSAVTRYLDSLPLAR